MMWTIVMWTIDQEAAWETMLEKPLALRPQPIAPPVRLGQEPPPVAILGVPFDSLTQTQALAAIEKMIASGQPHYLATANVDFLVQARRDTELRRILVEADLVLCDGTPLVWASRWLGNALPERVAGADLVPDLIQIAAKKNYRLFFLGGKPEITAQAAANLQREHPRLAIAGYYSPPFRPLLEMPHEEIVRRIRAAKPDIVFVSFGCPKAEKWMAMHYRELGVPVLIGVGGTIDFLAGKLKRAPLWMQRNGLEWLFRLLQEPGRLAGRYGSDLWFFSRAILRQWWRLQRRPGLARYVPPSSAVVVEPTWRRIRVPERFDRVAIARAAPIWEDHAQRHCLLELANVEFIDSTAVALLVRLDKKLRAAGRRLVLLEPSRAVDRALKVMCLESFFLKAGDILEARQLIHSRSQEQVVLTAPLPCHTQPPLAWQGEITARNARQAWHLTRSQINALGCRGKNLAIDLSGVRYIDSAGVRLMLRARRQAQRLGAALTFTGVPAAVRKALELAKLEGLLRA